MCDTCRLQTAHWQIIYRVTYEDILYIPIPLSIPIPIYLYLYEALVWLTEVLVWLTQAQVCSLQVSHTGPAAGHLDTAKKKKDILKSMPAAPIPLQNRSTWLSAPFQFNSKPNSSPQLTGQQKRDTSYRRHLLLHNDRISLRDPRGLFTSKEKIP